MVDGNMTQWDTGVLRAVRAAASRSYSAQRGFVEVEDLQQEGYLYVLAHDRKVSEWIEEGKEGMAVLQQAVYYHLHRYTMQQRYLKDGTRPEDYFVYQQAVIAELLPDVLDDNAVYGGSTSDLNGLVKSGKSLAEGGDRMAMIADIKAALLRLTVDERELLLRKYGPDATDDLLVQWYEATLDAMNKRVLRVVRKVAKHLGSEPVRRRKSISNAQAQHITREQE